MRCRRDAAPFGRIIFPVIRDIVERLHFIVAHLGPRVQDGIVQMSRLPRFPSRRRFRRIRMRTTGVHVMEAETGGDTPLAYSGLPAVRTMISTYLLAIQGYPRLDRGE